MNFLHAFSGVISLLLVVALGYFLGARGWFPAASRNVLPRLVTNVSLPPFMACTIISSVSRADLSFMFLGALPPLIAMGTLFALAWIAAKITRVSKKRFGLFCACVSNSNTVFIGIPVNLALFGPESLPYALIYYFASTTFFWTICNYFIGGDEGDGSGKSVKKYKKGIQWDIIISGPMYGFLIGLGFALAEIKPPEFLFNSARLVGDMTTPLALIFIGLTLQGMGLANIRLDRDMIMALIGRMVLSPLFMWMTLSFFGLPRLMEKVFITQSSLPVLMQVAILSAYYKTDARFGSIMVSVSTILCAITIPVLMIFIQ